MKHGLDKNLTVAVLGPLGTYTHEAAYQRFGHVEYLEETTIKDVFDRVLSTADLGVVPQENSIFGSVSETYDVLRKPASGFVRGEIILQIQHCLLTRQGVDIRDIRTVMSHEQALGQCQNFLATYLPSATLVKTSSTAAAARALLSSPIDRAAIASKICVTLFNGLTVQHEGIQDETSNFTRFYIIVKNRRIAFPNFLVAEPYHALVQISVQELSDTRADIFQLISALGLKLLRLDRRPKIASVPFHDTYLIELYDVGRHRSSQQWASAVDGAIARVETMGGNAELMGLW